MDAAPRWRFAVASYIAHPRQFPSVGLSPFRSSTGIDQTTLSNQSDPRTHSYPSPKATTTSEFYLPAVIRPIVIFSLPVSYTPMPHLFHVAERVLVNEGKHALYLYLAEVQMGFHFAA